MNTCLATPVSAPLNSPVSAPVGTPVTTPVRTLVNTSMSTPVRTQRSSPLPKTSLLFAECSYRYVYIDRYIGTHFEGQQPAY